MPDGNQAADLEVLLRTEVFKPVSTLLETLLKQAVERIEAAYQCLVNRVGLHVAAWQ